MIAKAPAGTTVSYPAPPSTTAVDTIHGVPIPDPYRPLEDGESEVVRKWMQAEGALSSRMFRESPNIGRTREALASERNAEQRKLPVRRGDRVFYLRTLAHESRPSIVVRHEPSGSERVLLRPGQEPLSAGAALRSIDVSPEGRYVALMVSYRGEDTTTLRLMEANTGELLPESLTDLRIAEPQWLPDSSGFFYIWVPVGVQATELYGQAEVRFHRIANEAEKDPIVFGPTKDRERLLSCLLTKNGEWLLVGSRKGRERASYWARRAKDVLRGSGVPNQAKTVNANLKNAGESGKTGFEWISIPLDTSAVHYPEPGLDAFYFRSNENAARFQGIRIAFDASGRPIRTTVVPEDANRTLVAVRVTGEHLAVRWSTGLEMPLEMRNLDGEHPVVIPPPGPGTFVGPTGQPRQKEAFLQFSSYDRRHEYYTLDTSTHALRLWWSPTSSGAESFYKMTTVPFMTRDGRKSVIYVAGRKDAFDSGPRQLMLSGYGGFSTNRYPRHVPGVLTWMGAGGLYAEAVVRGGGEYGEDWHKEGMRRKKANSFEDFAAAAETLVRLGITSPDKLVARGESNGGLLVAGTIVRYPSLFRAAVIRAPLTDMVRYPRVGGARLWVPEYGDPDDPEDLAALLAYSPYHRVQKGQRYPHVLVVTPEKDPRVDPMHSRKFVAAMQASSSRPVFLAFERTSGHMGSEDLNDWVENEAESLAFALDALGGRFEDWKTEVAR